MSDLLTPSNVRSRWNRTYAALLHAVERESATSDDSPALCDVTDELHDAMDELIERTEAPDLAALKVKLDLARGRSQGIQEPLFTDHARGIVADIYRLSERQADVGEPHATWLRERNRLFLICNRSGALTGASELAAHEGLADVEMRLFAEPAPTTVALLAKLTLLVELCAEGVDPNPSWVRSTLTDASVLTTFAIPAQLTGMAA